MRLSLNLNGMRQSYTNVKIIKSQLCVSWVGSIEDGDKNVSTPGTNIAATSWNWKRIANYCESESYFESNVLLDILTNTFKVSLDDIINFCNERIYFGLLFVVLDKLIEQKTDIKYLATKLNPAIIIHDNRHNLFDLYLLSLPSSDSDFNFISNLPPSKSAPSNYNTSHEEKDTYPMILNSEKLIHIAIKLYSPENGNTIRNMIEYGFSIKMMKQSCIGIYPTETRNEKLKYLKNAIGNFKMKKFKIMQSIIFLPREIQSIIFGYIPWWNDVEFDKNSEECINRYKGIIGKMFLFEWKIKRFTINKR